MIIDCPREDKRHRPTDYIPGVFFQEWMAGRKKEGWINHKGQFTFRLPVDEERIIDQCSWAPNGYDVRAVLLNWETLPIVQSREMGLEFRYDDAFALARTIDLIRQEIPGVYVALYGLRPWMLHRNFMHPQEIYDLYASCGVHPDSVAIYAVGRTADETHEIIEEKHGDFPMSVLTLGNDPDQSDLVQKLDLPEIRWY